MNKVRLKKRIGHRVINGHPWIFANEVEQVNGNIEGGETVLVETSDGKFLGQGYINPKSQILVRLLTRKKDDKIDDAFFLNRISKAWQYRQRSGIPKIAG
jgi:23S rRNA (cytosine1962-C5)-methyltransferase